MSNRFFVFIAASYISLHSLQLNAQTQRIEWGVDGCFIYERLEEKIKSKGYRIDCNKKRWDEGTSFEWVIYYPIINTDFAKPKVAAWVANSHYMSCTDNTKCITIREVYPDGSSCERLNDVWDFVGKVPKDIVTNAKLASVECKKANINVSTPPSLNKSRNNQSEVVVDSHSDKTNTSNSIEPSACIINDETSRTSWQKCENDTLGIVYDQSSELMWLRCPLGRRWNTNTKSCDGNRDELTWIDAIRKVTKFSYAGYSDWRLPSIEEFRSILLKAPKNNPYIGDKSIECQVRNFSNSLFNRRKSDGEVLDTYWLVDHTYSVTEPSTIDLAMFPPSFGRRMPVCEIISRSPTHDKNPVILVRSGKLDTWRWTSAQKEAFGKDADKILAKAKNEEDERRSAFNKKVDSFFEPLRYAQSTDIKCFDSGHSDESRNICLAITKRDPSYCNSGHIKNDESRKSCIAQATSDPSICFSLPGGDKQKLCLAGAKKDVTECYGINDHDNKVYCKAIFNQESCYSIRNTEIKLKCERDAK